MKPFEQKYLAGDGEWRGESWMRAEACALRWALERLTEVTS